MVEGQQLVGRLRAILEGATPRNASNDGRFAQIEGPHGRPVASLSYRWASARLEVTRIAARHGWGADVDRSLEDLGAPPLKYLGPGHLEHLETVLCQLRELELALEGARGVQETRAVYAA